jgi:enoyl-CoA hydratase
MADPIIVRQDGAILRVTFNRPDAGNGATDDMARELTRQLKTIGTGTRVVVLAGHGPDFCIGRASMGTPPAVQQEALVRRRQSDVIFDTYGAIRNCPAPVICAAQGQVLGFGCALAAVSDMTLAADTAVFQIPEMEHRIMPTMVMSALVDRATLKGLTYLVYSCARVSAERALSYGIVSDVVPAADLGARVDALAAKIVSTPPPASAGVKEYLGRAMQMDTQGAVDFARNIHAVINSSAEMKASKGGH